LVLASVFIPWHSALSCITIATYRVYAFLFTFLFFFAFYICPPLPWILWPYAFPSYSSYSSFSFDLHVLCHRCLYWHGAEFCVLFLPSMVSTTIYCYTSIDFLIFIYVLFSVFYFFYSFVLPGCLNSLPAYVHVYAFFVPYLRFLPGLGGWFPWVPVLLCLHVPYWIRFGFLCWTVFCRQIPLYLGADFTDFTFWLPVFYYTTPLILCLSDNMVLGGTTMPASTYLLWSEHLLLLPSCWIWYRVWRLCDGGPLTPLWPCGYHIFPVLYILEVFGLSCLPIGLGIVVPGRLEAHCYELLCLAIYVCYVVLEDSAFSCSTISWPLHVLMGRSDYILLEWWRWHLYPSSQVSSCLYPIALLPAGVPTGAECRSLGGEVTFWLFCCY
jgi:hypothetical protein